MTIRVLPDTATPIVAAPMAGGPSTLDLGAAIATAGGLPFLAAGYRTPETLAAEIASARTWHAPFGVNVFVPGTGAADADPVAFAAYADRLRADAAVYGVELDPTPRPDDDHWSEKLDLLVSDPVPVVSFTFALPSAEDIRRLQRAGSAVWMSITTVDEATAASAAGVDALVVQGAAAGGHSATWDPHRQIEDQTTEQLVVAVRNVTRLPLIAAGGIDGPTRMRGFLAAGADAVAVGTLLLRAHEAGTSLVHREALASGSADTTITRAFTGRPARALRNDFVDRHDAYAPIAYPAVHHLTRELRRRATAAGDTDRVHLWAGTGYRNGTAAPAATIIEDLTSLL